MLNIWFDDIHTIVQVLDSLKLNCQQMKRACLCLWGLDLRSQQPFLPAILLLQICLTPQLPILMHNMVQSVDKVKLNICYLCWILLSQLKYIETNKWNIKNNLKGEFLRTKNLKHYAFPFSLLPWNIHLMTI